MRTYVPKQAEVRQDWWIVDAEGLTLGRLATQVAARLRGKHRAAFTPFLDNGDHVVVVNADKLVISGKKATDKIYRRHSQYPGGLKEIAAGKLLAQRPARVVEIAVRGMLPKGPLGRKLFRKLKVYTGPSHPHEAQRPQPMPLVAGTRAREGRD
jgi:large subunit ribosomal protein L13